MEVDNRSMENPQQLIAPDDEVEAQGLIVLLDEERIEHVALRQRDSAYPGIADFGRWGVILVGEEDLERAQLLAAEFIEASVGLGEVISSEDEVLFDDGGDEVDPGAPGTPRLAWGSVFLWGALTLSVFLNLTFLADWYNPPAELESYSTDGDLISVALYRAADEHPYEWTWYSVSRAWVETSFDEDVNGRPEKLVSVRSSENTEDVSSEVLRAMDPVSRMLSAPARRDRFYDDDQDGLYERAEFEVSGTVRVRASDTTGDGAIDRWDHVDGPVALDLDADGFAESTRCTSDGDTVRTFSALSCTLR